MLPLHKAEALSLSEVRSEDHFVVPMSIEIGGRRSCDGCASAKNGSRHDFAITLMLSGATLDTDPTSR